MVGIGAGAELFVPGINFFKGIVFNFMAQSSKSL